MRRPIARLCLVISLVCSLSLVSASARAEPSPKRVFELINARLSHMRDVAVYKRQNGRAVEDSERERVVLERAQESALAAGLDPESVASFYRLQIQAAKAIQYRYLAEWSFDPETASQPTPALDTQLRPTLIELGDALVAAIMSFLESGSCFQEHHRALFLESMTVEHLADSEKFELFDSMSTIDLSGSRSHCAATA